MLDNGGEFINDELMTYCANEQLTFTRGRVANKNDQCYIRLYVNFFQPSMKLRTKRARAVA
jgi:hypothetical protein